MLLLLFTPADGPPPVVTEPTGFFVPIMRSFLRNFAA